MKRTYTVTTLVLGLAIAGFFVADVSKANDIPPRGSQPLSQILSSVENANSGIITEAEFDDGFWEITLCTDRCEKLYVNPLSAEIERRRSTGMDRTPPEGSMRMSEVAGLVEANYAGVITEIEFDDGYWEVEMRDDGKKVSFDLDPRTGERRR